VIILRGFHCAVIKFFKYFAVSVVLIIFQFLIFSFLTMDRRVEFFVTFHSNPFSFGPFNKNATLLQLFLTNREITSLGGLTLAGPTGSVFALG
jgi:hypothetical protein